MEETMATKANIIKVYAQADSAKKVDIIIRYYPNFMGIVESYTDGLRYMIENEKAFNRQANRGELGVRVQAKGNHEERPYNISSHKESLWNGGTVYYEE